MLPKSSWERNNSVNCQPFGCAPLFGMSRYRQVYASSQFSSPFTFGAIDFFVGSSGGGNAIDTATFQISFSTTSAAVNGLSTNLNSNVGSNVQVFGTFGLSGVSPATLTFTGTPYAYNPANGNLLMDVVISGGSINSNGEQTFNRADNTGAVTSRAFSTGGGGGTDANGLVTEFDSPVVPEPATMGLVAFCL